MLLLCVSGEKTVCRPYLPKAAEDRIKQHVSKSIRSCSSSQKRILPARLCKSSPSFVPSLLLLIQPLDFIFHKILPVRNIMMTVDILFLFKAALFSIYLLLKPLSSKLVTPPSAEKKFVYSLKIVH